MLLETFRHFPDFELLDSGAGFRLEKWGQYRLARPDPQAIWQPHLPKSAWAEADAKFESRWIEKKHIQQPWIIKWPLPLAPGEVKTGDWSLSLHARLTAFKHTGIFAEQAANWQWLCKIVESESTSWQRKVESNKLRILNLFGYTGAASILLAKLGCFVTHVDASKPSLTWAKENQKLNSLPNESIRWILDDAVKFVKRELKRGAQYDGILMDPPAFGHSPSGKTWKFAEDFPKLLEDCVKLLSSDAKFMLINAYATNTSALALHNTLEDALSMQSTHGVSSHLAQTYHQTKLQNGTIFSGELCLSQQDGRLLSTGIFARWSK